MTETMFAPIQLFVARQALDVYLKYGGKMELTRGGAARAVQIASGLTGKHYKRSMAGKTEARDDLLLLHEACTTGRGIYIDENGRLTLE